MLTIDVFSIGKTMMLKMTWILAVMTIPVSQGSEIKIVAPYKPGPEPCALLCAGTTGIGKTQWTEDHMWGVRATVDMKACGFVSTPIVNAVVVGDSYHRWATGTSAIYYLSKTQFTVKPARSNRYDTLSLAKKYNWRVDWQAVGYTCQ
jgi:hypothetical protein